MLSADGGDVAAIRELNELLEKRLGRRSAFLIVSPWPEHGLLAVAHFEFFDEPALLGLIATLQQCLGDVAWTDRASVRGLMRAGRRVFALMAAPAVH